MAINFQVTSFVIKTLFDKATMRFFIRGVSVVAFLVIMFSNPVAAQNVLTLKQAINNGFLNRKNILAGRTDMAVRQLQTEALYIKYWPRISAEYTYLYNPILQTSILPIGIFNPSYPPDAVQSVQFGTKWTQTAGISLNQPLLDLSIQRSIHEAKLQERITAASQSQTEYELASTVAETYFDICMQESKIRSAVADTARTYTNYQLLKNKYDENRVLKSDLNKSLINHHNAVQHLHDAVSELIENKVFLLFLTGETDIEKADFVTDTNFVALYEQTVSDKQAASATIPELQQLELRKQLTGLQSRTEKAKRLPVISIKGFLGANQYADKFDPAATNSWFGQSYVGLDVNLPILSGENTHKNIQVYRLQAAQYDQQLEDKKAQYNKDIFTSKLKMEMILSQLETQKENLLLSLESLDITRTRVQEGQESASVLNSDEADFQSLKADYEANKKQLWVYWLNYLKASGQLPVLWK